MNPPSHTDPAASTTPSIEQQPMSEPLMSTNLNGLQAMLQLAAMMSQNPLGNINLSGASPLGPSTTPQPQFQQPTPAPHVLQTQSAPNLLSLLGVQGNAFASPALGTLIAAGAPVGSCENDEEVLLKALRESSGKAWTYRQALDSLHGVSVQRGCPCIIRLIRPPLIIRSIIIPHNSGKTIIWIILPV